MSIPRKLIDRLNVLAKKHKESKLTEQEFLERAELRKKYLKLFREGFKQRIENIDITMSEIDDKGNEIKVTKPATELVKYIKTKNTK